MNPLGTAQPYMPDEIEPPGYEHGPMGEMGEAPHYGEVIPFPMMEPEEPEHVRALQQRVMFLQRLMQIENVAEFLKEDELGKLGQAVVREYDIDHDSRKDWETSAKRAMDIAKQVVTSKSHPWEGASNVKYPMLTTAALQFAARAYPAIVDGPRIVKCQVLGRDPDGRKAAMADRVSQHMSYQFLYEIPDWESDMDTCLHQIPIVGCAFKKVYPNSMSEAGVCSDLVSAFDLVVHQRTKSLRNVPRITHRFLLYPHQIAERQREGKFLEVELGAHGEDGNDGDSPHLFLEQHRYWDMDSDGVLEPWIVTVHKDTSKVVRIKPCFDMDKVVLDQDKGRIVRIPRHEYWVKIPFLPDPEGGFYDIGFGKLLEAVSDVIDTTINQMMDAGTLQNSGGGFAASGAQLGGKSRIRFKPGEYVTVPGTGDDIRKALVNMEHPGPAPVLFQLLEMMIAAGKDIASVKDVLTGETPTNQTATSTMAAIEQGLKVFTAIYKRIFRALKEEYRLVYEINKATLNQPKYVALLDEPVEVTAMDYHDDLDVMPVSDPNAVTDMQRLAKAQFVMEQVEKGNPFIDGMEATKRALEAARIDDVSKILKPPQGPPPEAQIAIEDGIAGVELKKAQAVKTAADAVVSAASVGLPVALPMAPEQFIIPLGGQPPMQPAPQPPQDMGGPPMEITPEEMMLLGGGEPPPPEAAPVPPGLAGLA